jgi:hypothetical protein
LAPSPAARRRMSYDANDESESSMSSLSRQPHHTTLTYLCPTTWPSMILSCVTLAWSMVCHHHLHQEP